MWCFWKRRDCTSYNNPKGNAETERMMRTIKEEAIWVRKFTSLEEIKEAVGQWIEEDYNQFYPYSKRDISLLESLRNNVMNFEGSVLQDLYTSGG